MRKLDALNTGNLLENLRGSIVLDFNCKAVEQSIVIISDGVGISRETILDFIQNTILLNPSLVRILLNISGNGDPIRALLSFRSNLG